MQRFKKLVISILTAGVFPLAAGHHAIFTLTGSQYFFYTATQLLSLIPGITGQLIRFAFFKHALSHCGNNCFFGFGSLLTSADSSVGDNVYIGPYSMLGNVCIRKDVLIGSHVSIINGGKQHGIERLDIPIREQKGEFPKVTIGRDTWIGDKAIVMADIGNHCVIGAGSVVTTPIPDYSIAVGNPARVIRDRRDSADAATTQHTQKAPAE